MFSKLHLHTTACTDCQKGNCCGSCWCCYDRDRRFTTWLKSVITSARRLTAIENSREYYLKQII